MNTKPEDVVKNVESKNLESTSNEQRQTVKPIIVSRRRLLRAGVAGIPVALTMAGIAPGQFNGQWSAASGLDYDGKHTLERFSQIHGDVLDDGLIESDEDGFIIKKNGDYYQEELSSVSDNFEANVDNSSITTTTPNKTGTGTPVTNPPASLSFVLSIQGDNGADVLTIPARLNKNGYYYVQADDNEIAFDSSKLQIELSADAVTAGYSIQGAATFSNPSSVTLNTGSWYPVQDYDWQQVPETQASKSVTVTLTATVPIKLNTKNTDDPPQDVSYTFDATVTCTLLLTMSTPSITFGKRTDW